VSNSAERRAKQTVRNLVFSLLATLGAVAILVLGLPRDDSSLIQRVDYQNVAAEAEAALGKAVLAPVVPADWWSNAARMEKQLGLNAWYVGFVTTDSQFIAITQVFEPNPSWEADILEGNLVTGRREISGLTWEIYPTRTPSNPPGTKELVMLSRQPGSTIAIFGTAAESDFEILATAIAEELAN
jgi:hypothetical protein